jgi:peptidyl-prolyl cis-trans isomerase B (cyclophilin B)
VRRPLLALAILALPVGGCGSSGKSTTADIPSAKPPSTLAQSGSPAGSSAKGCRQVTNRPRKPGKQKKPSNPLDAGKTWTLEFKTSCGNFTVALDLKRGPNASASMVSLAKAGFFTNTTFHRIVPGFVIQGGDPTASGTGGPGYKTVDKPPKSTRYTKGVVAMAKTPTEPPGTAGSQFYVVTGADAGLPPDYAVLGKVTKGMATVDRIGALGDQSEKPTQTVAIYGVVARAR